MIRLRIAHAAILLFFLLRAAVFAQVIDERALRIHREAIVVDAHADSLTRIIDAGDDLGARTDHGDIDIPRLREGGVDCQFFSIFAAPIFRTYGFFKRSIDLLDVYHNFVERYSQALAPARTIADVRLAVAQGKIATMLGVEGGQSIDNDLHILSIFSRLGVRYMSLTWSFSMDWAGSSGEAAGENLGLTAFGKNVVHEMNRLGIAVDVSHLSDKAFYDALEASSKPIIASHSSCRALAAHPRNLSDDMLRALAARGGVVGINYYPCFLDDRFRKDFNALEEHLAPRIKQIRDSYRSRPALGWAEQEIFLRQESKVLHRVSIGRLADHIEHAVKVAGVDHVGLGSDFDGTDAQIQGLEDCSKLPALTAELLHRGFSESDVKKILGENFLRVFQEIIGK